MLSIKRDSLLKLKISGILFATLCYIFYRLPFFKRPLDSDEAIVGLMAKHILEGAPPPTFYYGQAYMGAFEPLVATAIFVINGISSNSLMLAPFFISILTVPLTWELAALLFKNHLDKIIYPFIASMLISIAPSAIAEWSTRARGGFTAAIVFSISVLIITIRLVQNLSWSLFEFACLGLILGFGWWTNNQLVFAGLTAFLCVSSVSIIRLAKGALTAQRFVAFCLVGFLGFLVGSGPYWWHNFVNNFPSFGIASFSNQPLQNVLGFFTVAFPILGGAKLMWDKLDIFYGASFLLASVVALVLFSVFPLIRHFDFLSVSSKIDRGAITALIVFCFVTIFIFCISSFGSLSLSPRYLFPLYPAMYCLVAAFIAIAVFSLKIFVLCSIFSLAVCSSIKFSAKEPFITDTERVSASHEKLIDFLSSKKKSFIRTNYWVGYRLAFETNETIRFVQLGHPFQIRIDSYENLGRMLPISQTPFVVTDSQSVILEEAFKLTKCPFLSHMNKDTLIGYNIYEIFDSPECFFSRDLTSFRQLTAKDMAIFASHGSSSTYLMIDNDQATRWGSSKPRSEGMEVTIEFTKPHKMCGVFLLGGKFSHDLSESLSISCELASNGDSSYELVSFYSSYVIRKASDMLREDLPLFIDLKEPSKPCKKIKIRNASSHPVFDWSIAELRLLVAD